MGLWSYCSGIILERLNLNINYQSWSSYLYFSGFMWVFISNSIKREKENRLGNRWVIGQDRNCTVIKSLIWWILFNIWVSRSHYESEQQMFRKTRDWLHHFTDFTLIEMFCDWTHLFMRLLKLWTQLWLNKQKNGKHT